MLKKRGANFENMKNKKALVGWIILIVGIVVIVGIGIYYYPQNTGYVVNQNTASTYITQQVSTTPQNVVIASETSNLGQIVTDLSGMTLYIFRADTNGQSTCYNQCADAWLPLLVSNRVMPTGIGVTATLGTITRTDGTYQVTVNRMPLYYFSGDKAAGDINGQGLNGFGALWYVISPSGDQITTPNVVPVVPTSNSTTTTNSTYPSQNYGSSSSSSSSSSNYGY